MRHELKTKIPHTTRQYRYRKCPLLWLMYVDRSDLWPNSQVNTQMQQQIPDDVDNISSEQINRCIDDAIEIRNVSSTLIWLYCGVCLFNHVFIFIYCQCCDVSLIGIHGIAIKQKQNYKRWFCLCVLCGGHFVLDTHSFAGWTLNGRQGGV